MGAVRLECDGLGTVTLSATNYELWLETQMPAEGKPCVFVVPHAALREWSAGESVEFSLALGAVNIKSGGRKAKIATIPPHEFPAEKPPVDECSLFTFSNGALADALERSEHMLSKGLGRVILEYSYLTEDGSIVATDGMGLVRIPLIDDGPEAPVAITPDIPWRLLEGSMELRVYGASLTVTAGHRRAMAPRPNYRLPGNMRAAAGGAWGDTDEAVKWTAPDRDKLERVLKFFLPHVDILIHAEFHFDEKGITLKHRDTAGNEREDRIDCPVEPGIEPINLGVRKLLSVLSAFPEGPIRLGVLGPRCPIVIKCLGKDKARAIQLPVFFR